mmetsp:Transcript_4327/g.9374  ORF Transcript_4327/g.9374 Transcript_4327/m.9374 type:complete len:387 (+) Transcript_4327:2451-3611(+)
MNVFAHLEAHDILGTAQVSVIMYSRVDILFGLGGATHADADGDGGAEGGGGAGAGTAVDTAGGGGGARQLPQQGTTAASAAPSTTGAAAAAAAAEGLALAAGGLFSQLGLAKTTTTAGEGAATTAAASTQTATTTPAAAAAGGGDPLFSAAVSAAAAPPTVPSSSSAAAAAASVEGAAASGVVVKGRAPMLTPEVANSMAEKLSRDELGVIISMQKAQRAAETDLGRLRNERDDLIAELKGVESVKDFLVAKLRDAERAQRMAESEKEKVARQVTSDQEVIAFLDYRVQELESSSEAADLEKAAVEDELKAAKAKSTERVRVLGDMLRFERDQLAANEKEWKATKKVLVKEVKQCRAQIVSLEAERDGLREQNSRLRDALLNGGKM